MKTTSFVLLPFQLLGSPQRSSLPRQGEGVGEGIRAERQHLRRTDREDVDGTEAFLREFHPIRLRDGGNRLRGFRERSLVPAGNIRRMHAWLDLALQRKIETEN